MNAKQKTATGGTIAQNKKSRHEYFIEERLEAGIVLQGWEVKSLRAGRCQLVDSYVILQGGEAFLIGAHISPMNSTSTHVLPQADRSRKLLLHERELARLASGVEKDGCTAVCTAMYWDRHLVKCEIALARGKKMHDKRATEKERDWDRQKQRLVRHAK